MPKVLNNRRDYIPVDAIYVGRPSKWGNPFRMKGEKDRARCIEEYENWLAVQPRLMAEVRDELKGKDLVCWCSPKRCHADVLLKIANRK